jgi:aldose 1-epimerase
MVSPAPSGRQIVLRHDQQEAVVVEVGGGLRTYQAAGVAVLDGYAEDERCSSGRGQPLIPWPNRLEDGSYRFEQVEEQAPLSEPPTGNAIHGLTRWQPWQLFESGTGRAVLACTLHPQPGWAWTLDLRITYRLSETGLDVALAARNRSTTRCPFGAGFHPYLAAPTGRVDDMELLVPASTRYQNDARGLPTGTEAVAGGDADFRAAAVIGERKLDVAYTDLTRDAQGMAVVEVRDPRTAGAVAVRVDPSWTHLMVFTGDTVGARARQGLAIEPMTGPANLLRSGDGLVTIEPDEVWEGTWAVTPSWLG